MNRQPDYYRTFNTKKFKSDVMAYYYVMDLHPYNATYATLLTNVLLSGSEKYPDIQSMTKRQQELYGLRLSMNLSTYGRYLVLEIKSVFPSGKYISSSSIEDDAREFLTQVLYHPLLEKGRFNESVFQREKDNLQLELENIVKDLPLYCYRKCMELTFQQSPLGTYKYGDVKTLEKITSESLIAFYRDLISKAPFYILEDGEKEEVKEGEILQPLVMEESVKLHRPPICQEETKEAFQSLLTQSYLYKGPQGEEESYPVQLLNMIIGGGVNSLLFRKVREERGYCYYIYTSYDRFRQLMTLNVGFDGVNEKPMLNLIEEIFQEAAEGKITPKDLEGAKSEFTRQLKSLADDQGQQLGYHFIRDAFGFSSSIEDRMKAIGKVTLDEVVEAAKNLYFHAQYMIKGREE